MVADHEGVRHADDPLAIGCPATGNEREVHAFARRELGQSVPCALRNARRVGGRCDRRYCPVDIESNEKRRTPKARHEPRGRSRRVPGPRSFMSALATHAPHTTACWCAMIAVARAR